MKQAYVEPEVQVLFLSLEVSLLNGGSNEDILPPIPGEWNPAPPFSSFPF